MPRSRRSASSEVLASAQAFSDRLLLLEHDCFAAMERRFAAAVPRVESLLRSRLVATGGRPVGDARLEEGLLTRLRSVLGQCGEDVDGLLARAVPHAVSSIQDELTVCESTLTRKYRGVTVQAVDRAEAVSALQVEAASQAFRAWDDRRVQAFARSWLQQATQWTAGMEDRRLLTARLTSTDPVREAGRVGRGIWWEPLWSCEASARECVIRLVNQVRESAMESFNDQVAGRG